MYHDDRKSFVRTIERNASGRKTASWTVLSLKLSFLFAELFSIQILRCGKLLEMKKTAFMQICRL
jgi:hypothetical protein